MRAELDYERLSITNDATQKTEVLGEPLAKRQRCKLGDGYRMGVRQFVRGPKKSRLPDS
jgi:hypothetical protein